MSSGWNFAATMTRSFIFRGCGRRRKFGRRLRRGAIATGGRRGCSINCTGEARPGFGNGTGTFIRSREGSGRRCVRQSYPPPVGARLCNDRSRNTVIPIREEHYTAAQGATLVSQRSVGRPKALLADDGRACAFTWRTEFLLPVVRDAAGADEFDSLAGAILQPGRIFCG